MHEASINKDLIIKNTLFLYIRLLLSTIVALYTSRVVLQSLGVSDYGLYNVVGGIVLLFTFVNNTLRSGTGRFFSFVLGEGDTCKIKNIFSVSFYFHILLSFLILVLSEIIGLWLIHCIMQIPDGRMNAAVWILHFSVAASMFSIIQIPFEALIISFERMGIFAYISIIDVSLKLLAAFAIQVVDNDKLIFYAFLMMVVHIIMSVLLILYSRRQFRDCLCFDSFDKKVFKEVSSFAGWDAMRSIAVVLQNHGLNVLLNIFFGVVVNAAKGIAFQVNAVIQSFVLNLQEAVNPQIVKLYASGEKLKMTKLVLSNSKLSAFLFMFMAIPVCIEIDYILSFWLVTYPKHTSSFIRILMLLTLIGTMTQPVVMAVKAVGRMKNVNLTASVALLMILPICYFLLLWGCTPETALLVYIIPWSIELFFYLFWLHKYIDFPIIRFYKEVYGKVIPLGLLALVPPLGIHFMMEFGFIRFLLVCICSVLTSGIVFTLLGMTNGQKAYLYSIVRKNLSVILR